MIRRIGLLALFGFGTLQAQDYAWVRMLPGSSSCPRREIDADRRMGPAQARNPSATRDAWAKSEGEMVFPSGERKDASAFTCYDENKKAVSIASLRGKVVVVGIWASACEPSIHALAEMAQLQPMGDQKGFAILPCHLESWVNTGQVRRSNPAYFKDTKFYKAGLGSEGIISNLSVGPDLTALPTTIVIDREGKVAYVWTGLAGNRLVQRLSQVLREGAVPAKPAAVPAPAPAPAPAPIPN
ncbi:MAG TPA: TlpA disulfide reductase family protein [Holophagaceae bacterium]|nr:TlpA disulfide reductase family protein [Holophagaceae bacterium]